MSKRAPLLILGLAVTALSIAACGGDGGGGPHVAACRTANGTPAAETPTAGPPATVTLKVGSYTGTGSPQCIRGVGFQPEVLIIKGDTTESAAWRSSSMSGDSTAYFADRIPNFEDGITSLDPDAFSLGEDPSVNAEEVTYQYVAFPSYADIRVGSYIGDGAGGRSISGIGFQPDLVWLKGDVYEAAVWRSSEMPGDRTALFTTGREIVDAIEALESDGFQVGSHPAVNGPTSVVHYVAFRAVPGSLAVGTYTGNGLDNRSITGLGLEPDYVWVKVDSVATSMVHRSSGLEGDTTMRIIDAINAPNEIQALEADGFQVGTGNVVNTDGDRYRYVAWKATGTGPAP